MYYLIMFIQIRNPSIIYCGEIFVLNKLNKLCSKTTPLHNNVLTETVLSLKTKHTLNCSSGLFCL